MKHEIISQIQTQMSPYLNQGQSLILAKVLANVLGNASVSVDELDLADLDNFELLNIFLSAKRVEGCSKNTLKYYKSTITKLLVGLDKPVENIRTDDLRNYLEEYRQVNHVSKTTTDNIRRIFSSFFTWLEDEDYILKNPVKRIHRIKTGRSVKEILNDEELEMLCDSCDNIRDLAIMELLISTGMRVGELVGLNIEDVNFNERECIVFGKGESQRFVYFDARCKIHLLEYLNARHDCNEALFVSSRKPYGRLGINRIEGIVKGLGEKSNISNVHPHRFRRTLATNAIDKGMPIEQVQKLLGHMQIDTTMQYAMVKQNNVKNAHRKFIS